MRDRDRDEQAGMAKLYEELQRLAAQQGLGPDVVHDAFLETMDERYPPRGRAALARHLDAVATRGRMQALRQARSTRAAQSAPPRNCGSERSKPVICAELARWAEFAEDSRSYLAELRRAVVHVGHEPGVLRDSQLRLFDWAYVDGRSIPAITRIGELPGDRATVERLRRIAARVERHVRTEVERHLGAGFAGAEAATRSVPDPCAVRNVVSTERAAICSAIARALRAIRCANP